MNFIEKLASYRLWYLLSTDLPSLAIQWIEEWYKSESLYTLAWLKAWNNKFELVEYLNKTLVELNIKSLSNEEFFHILLKYYLVNLKSKKLDFKYWMNQIYTKFIVWGNYDWFNTIKKLHCRELLEKLENNFVQYEEFIWELNTLSVSSLTFDRRYFLLEITKKIKKETYTDIDIYLDTL